MFQRSQCALQRTLSGRCMSSRVRRWEALLIARHVERRLGLGFNNGCSYFRCYGEEVGPMWKAFGTTLLAYCGPRDERAVLTAACRTFEILHRWLCSP